MNSNCHHPPRSPAFAADQHSRPHHRLVLRDFGIDTYQEPVVYMPMDCPVCRAEGWQAQTRVLVRRGRYETTATLNVVTGGLLAPGELGLSAAAWRALDTDATMPLLAGTSLEISPSPPLTSLRYVRAKIYGERLGPSQLRAIIDDVARGRYSSIELASFVTACATAGLDLHEIEGLTRSMIDVGERLTWDATTVVDKHCVGGLPGNRTTMIVVPIMAAAGLTMPKTSSRAITSPAGTADTMEVVAPVALDLLTMRRVVEREGACIVWGGGVALSPADDVIIQVERPLDLDSQGQLVASVLSKKVAAGATHVVLDIPVGPTAKVRSRVAAESLAHTLHAVASAMGLSTKVVISDGSWPVGRGVGPALEAIDVLKVLRGEHDAPQDLRERALLLGGVLLEMAGAASAGTGVSWARDLLDSGAAWRKFLAICEAQGGFREPSRAQFQHVVEAAQPGRITATDNRRLARAAKLVGAPMTATAGLELHCHLGATVDRGAPLYTLHAESPGELAYALEYVHGNTDIFTITRD